MAKIKTLRIDLKKAWAKIRHGKVAKWTLIVHFVYYVESTTHYAGLPMLLSGACAVALAFDFFAEDH